MSDSRRLLSNSSVLFIGTLAGSVFSYVFNMVMGRSLGPAAYGELTAVISFTGILSVFGVTVSLVVMRSSNELFHQKRLAALRRLFSVSTRFSFLAGLGIAALTLLFGGLIVSSLGLTNSWAVVLALVTFLFSLTTTVNRGVLQGVQKFSALSLSSVIEMGSKLALGSLVVVLGFGVNGALAAVASSIILTYLLTLRPVLSVFKHAEKTDQDVALNRREILSFVLPAFVSTALLSVLLNIDVILVKLFFPAEEAGLYAAISSIAKIILYLSTPVISVMFPMISEKRTRGEKHYKTLFLAMMLTAIASLVALSVYATAPGTIIRVLYGETYTNYYSLLPIAGLSVVIYALVNVMANYYLVVKDYFFLWICGLGLIGLFIGISLYHPSIEAVVRFFIFANGFILAGMVLRYLSTKQHQLREYIQQLSTTN